MARAVDDKQAKMIAAAVRAQRHAIVAELGRLARELGFEDDASAHAGPARADVVRAKHDGDRTFLFVGIARGFGEPAAHARHHATVERWVRRFARLMDKRRGKGAPPIDGGYVIVGTHDSLAAHEWASVLTTASRAHRIRRAGAPVRFMVRKLGVFWMAC